MSNIINFDSSLKQGLSLSPVSHTSYLYFSIYKFKKIIEKKDKVAWGTGDRDSQCCRVFTKKLDVENLKKVKRQEGIFETSLRQNGSARLD